MLSTIPINSRNSFYAFYARTVMWESLPGTTLHYLSHLLNYELRKQNNKDIVVFGVALGAVLLRNI